jgi:GMP synthase (glutamine-hydrolysing)
VTQSPPKSPDPTPGESATVQQAGPATTVLGIVHWPGDLPGHFAADIATHRYQLELASYATGRQPSYDVSDYAAVIVFGGAPQVDQDRIHPWLARERAAILTALQSGTPFLGICLGGQLLAQVLGARVAPATVPRTGWGDVLLTERAGSDALFTGLPRVLHTVVWHSYEFDIPHGAVALARSVASQQAFKVSGAPAWGLQFHPEVSPLMLRQWFTRLDKHHPDVLTSEHKQLILKTAVLRYDAQRTLATTVCGNFLRAAASAVAPAQPLRASELTAALTTFDLPLGPAPTTAASP